jgi:hypothetical protein
MKESVRVHSLTFPRELPLWEFGSPGGLPNFQRAIVGVKTQWIEEFYIIGKLLKRRCLKWVRMIHLDIQNTSYGQKKGRESNWQFEF